MRRILIIRRVGLGALLWEEDHKQSHNDINNRVHRQTELYSCTIAFFGNLMFIILYIKKYSSRKGIQALHQMAKGIHGTEKIQNV